MLTKEHEATQDEGRRRGQGGDPANPQGLLEQLIPGPVTPAEFEDIFQRFKKAFMERALGAEMAQHLGYKAGDAKPEQPPQWRRQQDDPD